LWTRVKQTSWQKLAQKPSRRGANSLACVFTPVLSSTL